MALTSDRLLDTLRALSKPAAYLLAFSGGRDSQVLLHLLAAVQKQLPARLAAVHIDHGLQSESLGWAVHCEQVCQTLGVPIKRLTLRLSPARGESVEAQARTARYEALSELLGEGEMLLTAHHREDQAETVLLQLLRGAGPAGLSAMPLVTSFGNGLHCRPLLEVSAEQIQTYAESHHLSWVEDGSNSNDRFDRNFLRNQVIPLMRQRWPAMSRTLSRSARHCSEAQKLVEQTAHRLLHNLVDPRSGSLALPELLKLPACESRAVLRLWIRTSGFATPDTTRLDRILDEMGGAAEDRNPLVHWPGVEIRRYRGRLYVRPPLLTMDSEQVIAWSDDNPVELPAGLGQLRAVVGSFGLSLSAWRNSRIELRFKEQGGRLKPLGRAHSCTFKNYFQQLGIPPWLRTRIPLIYLDGELAAVSDFCICEPFGAPASEQGVRLEWIGHGLRELGDCYRP